MAAVLSFACRRSGEKEAEEKGEDNAHGAAPQRVSVEDGVTSIRLDAEAQRKTGLKLEPLAPASVRDDVRAHAVVLDLQPLTELRSTNVNASAQSAKVRSAAEAARREHQRVKLLFDDDRNASEKALDEATASLHAAEADLAAAEAPLRTTAALARQRYGPVIARWIAGGGPELESLLSGREVLIQVTLPPDQRLSPAPETVSLEATPGGGRQSARYVSAAGQTDPSIQGVSLLYRGAASTGLLPGMALLALLPSGPAQAGAVVPESAIVWWQGRAWAYAQAAPDRFARREIATSQPAPGGGYLVREPPAGTPVVVAGAQALLSEEFRSQIQVGEE
jgi:hypothetical protein